MAPGFSLGKARNKTPSFPRKRESNLIGHYADRIKMDPRFRGDDETCGPSWPRILPEDRLDGSQQRGP